MPYVCTETRIYTYIQQTHTQGSRQMCTVTSAHTETQTHAHGLQTHIWICLEEPFAGLSASSLVAESLLQLSLEPRVVVYQGVHILPTLQGCH